MTIPGLISTHAAHTGVVGLLMEVLHNATLIITEELKTKAREVKKNSLRNRWKINLNES